MSPEESKWWMERLGATPADQLSPIVNLGSSTRNYREVVNPFIHANLFAPLALRGVQIVHVDFKEADGVDVSGDFTQSAVQERIRALQTRAVLCNNMLEHVTDRPAVCAAIRSLLPVGGLAFVSVPRHYPYHPDPIDTGYRPSAAQLQADFGSDFATVNQAEVEFGNYLEQLRSKPWLLLRDAYLLVAGVAKVDCWRVFFGNYRHLLRQYSVTCVVLRRLA